MTSDCPSAKKEPPWLPILPPMPRISVSTPSRARLSHRRPIRLSPPTHLLPEAPSTPSPLLRAPKSVDQSSSYIVSETPLPTSPSALPSSVARASTWPASSPDVDSADRSEPESVCSVSDGDTAGNRTTSLDCTSALFPPNFDGCFPTIDPNTYVSGLEVPSSMPAAPQLGFSCEDYQELGMGATGGVQDGKDPPSSTPSEDGCAIPVAELTSSGACLDPREEMEGALVDDVRVKLEEGTDVDNGVEISCLGQNVKPVANEGELEDGQLPGDGVIDAKGGEFITERGSDRCISSDMELSVGDASLSVNCLGGSGVDDDSLNVKVENWSDIGCEPQIPDLGKSKGFVLDDGELEEGQLSGEWSGAEESEEEEGSGSPQTVESRVAVSSVVSRAPMLPMAVNAAGENYYPFEVEGIHSEQRSRGTGKPKGKKNKKHKKGEGSKKRSREKSKGKYNEVLKKRRVEKGWVDGVSNPNKKDSSFRGEQTQSSNNAVESKKEPQTTPKKAIVDEGPEDGEILLEATPVENGLLSSLVEAEVGLWTTDNVDDQFVTEMEQDGTVKKKRGPETAERKLKRKIAKRKKRAQKERELGIRRPPRATQNKPVKVLCTHYMKGRCTKGDQCTYSHDAIPSTKLEPCKFLMSHSCLKGDDCPYSHDLRAFPCKFFHTRGLCYDGDNCQFSHGAISEAALEKLKQRVEKEKKEKLSSTSAYDVVTPSFSTPLPPELDPDPLGWGTPGTYSGHEEPTQYANPSTLDQSTDIYGDFNLENHTSASTSRGILPSDGKESDFDAACARRIEERAEESKRAQATKAGPLQSVAAVDWRQGLDRAIEPSMPVGQTAADIACTSVMAQILKTPVYISLPNERSNAREASLEVSKMGGKVEGGQSAVEETSAIFSESCKMEDGVSQPSSLVPVLSSISQNSRIVMPLLRGRQIGGLVVESQKGVQSPSQAGIRRQQTVDSLLGQALRQ